MLLTALGGAVPVNAGAAPVSGARAADAALDRAVARFVRHPDGPPGIAVVVQRGGRAVLFRPGSRYHYSNTDNIIVGLMVAAATGKSYVRELRQRVFAPLGLRHTSLPRGAALPAPYVRGYEIAPPHPPTDISHVFAAGWAWASGGMVSTPRDINAFMRTYVRGATTSPAVRRAQFTFRPGSSGPPGPGVNSAGLSIFRYQTRCGTVYGHTGNTAGYTQFVAASKNGSRSVLVSINAQITPTVHPDRFPELRHIDTLAVCAALAH